MAIIIEGGIDIGLGITMDGTGGGPVDPATNTGGFSLAMITVPNHRYKSGSH